jgi:hypothetical protein
MAKPEDTPGKGKEDAPGQVKKEPVVTPYGGLTPVPAEEEKQGEAFTPEQAEQIKAGEYPTAKQLTPEEQDSKEDLQAEQEERIEQGNQGVALGKD